MKGQSLFTAVSWPRGRKPRRAVFLDRLDNLMPWGDLEVLVDPLYPKPLTGRPPYSLQVMVRLYVLTVAFELSDESAEDLILDSHSAALFVGLDPWRPRPPGASAIGNFRRLVDRVPGDRFHLALSMAMAAARAEFRLRWSQSFGQPPGENKLKPVPGLLILTFPDFIRIGSSAVELVGSRRPVGKRWATHRVVQGLSIGDRAGAVRRVPA